jgi:hypothetical protein
MATEFERSVIEMALAGFQAEAQRIEAAMVEIRKRLGMRGGKLAPMVTDGSKPIRHMSGLHRKRIADAQKKRWAAYHAEQGTPARQTTPRKAMSPERRAALVANLAKARAARMAKKTNS